MRIAEPGRPGSGRDSRVLLARAEARFRAAAERLREAGLPGEARRAELFAERVRADLGAPVTARPPGELLREPGASPGPASAVLDEILGFGLALLRAERGNLQLADPVTGTLRIAAQQGFGPEFLDHFAVVADDGSACGRAARRGGQVVIADVSADPGFVPHRAIAAAAGFRAVQSTPLLARNGQVAGVLSTHYARAGQLPGPELEIMARFGTLIGGWLGTLLGPDASGPSAGTVLLEEEFGNQSLYGLREQIS